MKKFYFIFPLLIISILPVSADFYSEMVTFLPDTNNFGANWKFTKIQAFENLQLDWSSETPNGVIQKFGFVDKTNDTEMITTISIYDFTDKQISSAIYKEYVSTLIENGYVEAPLLTNLQNDCFATTINEEENNEKTSITCTNSQYVIIATSEQTGNVFNQGQQMTTNKASNFLAGLMFEKIESKSNEIPDWVKNNAGWWAEGQIDDSDFIKGIKFLIEQGIIIVS